MPVQRLVPVYSLGGGMESGLLRGGIQPLISSQNIYSCGQRAEGPLTFLGAEIDTRQAR